MIDLGTRDDLTDAIEEVYRDYDEIGGRDTLRERVARGVREGRRPQDIIDNNRGLIMQFDSSEARYEIRLQRNGSQPQYRVEAERDRRGGEQRGRSDRERDREQHGRVRRRNEDITEFTAVVSLSIPIDEWQRDRDRDARPDEQAVADLLRRELRAAGTRLDCQVHSLRQVNEDNSQAVDRAIGTFSGYLQAATQ